MICFCRAAKSKASSGQASDFNVEGKSPKEREECQSKRSDLDNSVCDSGIQLAGNVIGSPKERLKDK